MVLFVDVMNMGFCAECIVQLLYRPVAIKGRQTSRPEKSAKIIDTSLYMTPWHNENLMYTTCPSMLKDFS